MAHLVWLRLGILLTIEDATELTSHLCNYSFSHVQRKGNTVADRLAKLAKFCSIPKIWKEDIPYDVNSLVSTKITQTKVPNISHD